MCDRLRFPLYRVTREGATEILGELTLVEEERVRIEPSGEPAVEFDHLPWYIQFLRPEGFLGRAFAHRMAAQHGLPAHPDWWSDRQLLFVLSHYGEDLPGDLLLGETSLRRFEDSRRQARIIPVEGRRSVYPALVRQALAGGLPGSSAGGEQPKFAALVAGTDKPRHVLVKFSPPVDTPHGRRLADLLVCEHLALDVLREGGVSAAETAVLVEDDRVYLESTRFDRFGPRGRSALVSLAALDDEFRGRRDTWSSAAADFQRLGWLSAEDAEGIELMDLFGAMIGNTDRHFGNLSLRLTEGSLFAPRRFSPAPAYDMLPAAYSPKWSELVPVAVHRIRWDAASPQADRARTLALSFWRRVAEDGRLSAEWQEIADEHAEHIVEFSGMSSPGCR